MTDLKLSIPDELMAVVAAQVAEGRYGSPDEYVQALLERDERRRHAKRALDDKIQEGLDSGPGTPMTREDWVALRREAIDGLAGETIRP